MPLLVDAVACGRLPKPVSCQSYRAPRRQLGGDGPCFRDQPWGLLILLVAVLPGSVFTWAFERQASAYGVTLADRTLRFVAISLLFHLALAWPEYGLFRLALGTGRLATGQFAAAWGAASLLVLAPGLVGSVLGGLYATRNSRDGWLWLRKVISANNERRLLKLALGRTPAPRAWDHLFSERPNVYMRVRTVDGSWVAGRFAKDSYAGGHPNDADLLLEQAWTINAEDGTLGDDGLGYAVYVPASQISRLEIIQEVSDEREG